MDTIQYTENNRMLVVREWRKKEQLVLERVFHFFLLVTMEGLAGADVGRRWRSSSPRYFTNE